MDKCRWRYQDHWAFEKVEEFVLQKDNAIKVNVRLIPLLLIGSKRLACLNGEASKELIRRVKFDLWMPPTKKKLIDFLNDILMLTRNWSIAY